MKSQSLILEVLKLRGKVSVSLFENEATARQYYEMSLSLKEIESLCKDIINILNKSNETGHLAAHLANNLKKTGQLLYDQLLPGEIKDRLQRTKVKNLILVIDEPIVQIPWELLFNGKEYLCLKFNIGRKIKTHHALSNKAQRPFKVPAKMLLIADPTSNLKASRVEAMVVSDVIDKNRKNIKLATKVRNVSKMYIKKNMRSYDILHYAGHSEINHKRPKQSGWVLNDGCLTAKEIIVMGTTSSFPRLIFSNSCQSAHEKTQLIHFDMEDRTYSLALAFLVSSVHFYVGALWKIPDEAAVFFAKEFYQQLTNNRSIGEAMRKARHYLIKMFSQDSIIWSSYVFYGDPAATFFPVKYSHNKT